MSNSSDVAPPSKTETKLAANDAPKPDFVGGSPKIEGLKAGAELAKQLTTLAVGMVALTITFLKDIVQPVANGARAIPLTMIGAWSFYVLCLLGAVATRMGISGTLTNLDRLAMGLPERKGHEGAHDVYCSTVRIPMIVMVLSFLFAIILTVVAAARSY